MMTQVWIDAFVEARDMHIGMVESLGIIGISLLLLSHRSAAGPQFFVCRLAEGKISELCNDTGNGVFAISG